jgi:hypothetical protein
MTTIITAIIMRITGTSAESATSIATENLTRGLAERNVLRSIAGYPAVDRRDLRQGPAVAQSFNLRFVITQ